MPRRPQGTYTRPTGDIFQHSRANASGWAFSSSNAGIWIAIFNNDQSGQVCHVLGVNVSIASNWIDGFQSWCDLAYLSGAGTPLGSGDTWNPRPISAFFDLDPVPSVTIDGFYGVGITPTLTQILPLQVVAPSSDQNLADQIVGIAASYYPPGGCAAFKPGRGFGIFFDIETGYPPGGQLLAASFDLVMLPD